MPDDTRRQMEMEAALKQIESIQRRQAKKNGRRWRLDVSLAKLAFQGVIVFITGVLVGLGAFVLLRILFA